MLVKIEKSLSELEKLYSEVGLKNERVKAGFIKLLALLKELERSARINRIIERVESMLG